MPSSTVSNNDDRKIEFFGKIESLYPTNHEAIRRGIDGAIQDINNPSSSYVGVGTEEDFLDYLGDILVEREGILQQYKNVKRQENAIRGAELNPGKVNIIELNKVQRDRLRRDGESEEDFLDRTKKYDLGKNTSSIWGGNKEDIKRVKEREEPPLFIEKPDRLYRNLVFDAAEELEDEIRVNDEKLKILIEKKELDLEDEDTKGRLKNVRVRLSPERQAASNIGETALEVVLRTINWAGKGMISSSQASEDERYEKYLQNRNELLTQLIWKLNPRDSSAYLEIQKRVNAALCNSSDILDQASFQAISDLIATEIIKENAASEIELKAFNARIQELNEGMLKKLQEHVDTEDDMWKYRVLQLVLMTSPFGGIMYMGTLSNLLGPIFSASTSIGTGIGSIASSNSLGVFGDIAGGLHIDDAISGILNETPIISDVLGVVDALTDSYVGQQFMGATGGVIFSPLLPIGIAAAYSLSRADTEITHYQKSHVDIEAEEKKLRDEIEKFEKEREEGRKANKPGEDRKWGGNLLTEAEAAKDENIGLRGRVDKFVEQKFEILKQSYVDVKMAEFICEQMNSDKDEKLEALLGDKKNVQFDFGDRMGTMLDFKAHLKKSGQKISEDQILHFIQSRTDVGEHLKTQFLLFEASDNLSEFEDNQQLTDDEKSKFIQSQRKQFDEEFLEQRARKFNITSKETGDKRSEYLAKKIKEREFMNVYLGEAPNNRCGEPITVSPLSQNSRVKS